VVQLVEHLVVPVVGIDRHDARPERVQREIVQEEFRPILEEQRDAMPVPIPGRRVTLSVTQHVGADLPVRQLDAIRMIGTPGRRRHRQERMIRRRLRRRHERLEHRLHRAALFPAAADLSSRPTQSTRNARSNRGRARWR
jgi:hypothetical protein